ncbi:MAG: glycine zipper 2TM domain-containing protein [Bacteroidota bacterium]
MAKGLVVGAVSVVAISASGVVGYKVLTAPSYAEVLAVKDLKETVRTPRQECHDVRVEKKAPVRDEQRIAGTVIGGVLGGLVGSQIGHGTGNTVATVAGAAAGGYAGNTVQKGMQNRDTVASTAQRCKTVYDVAEKFVGYDVSYRLDGKEGRVQLAYDPGQRIPVKDGKLVLHSPESAK